MMDYFSALLPGIGYTVFVTAAAFAIGVVGGVPLVLLRRSALAPLSVAGRIVIDLVRSIPPITWLFLIFFGLPSVGISLAPVPAAVIGLGLIASAHLAEIYRSGLLAVPTGQWEAGSALGLGRTTLMTSVIGPQAMRVVVPPAATVAISLLKDSAIASTIGVLDVTYRANAETMSHGHGLEFFGAAALIYIALSIPLAVVSRRVDSRTRARYSFA